MNEGDLVIIVRPAGTYRAKGEAYDPRHPSGTRHDAVLVVGEPLAIRTVRGVTEQRPEAWVVLANGKAYPQAWAEVVA